MLLRFVTVDVFTRRQFGGNPLAVVLDAKGLSADQMQAIAAEFNLAETSFVLPPRDPRHTAQVRIFTPRAEMKFAGHPNIGTAFALAQAGEIYGRTLSGDRFLFEEEAGLVGLDLLREGGSLVGARLAAPQGLTISEEVAPDIVAACCSLTPSDISTERHRPCVVTTGASFIFAELRTYAALAKAKPRSEAFAQSVPMQRATGIHLYVHQKDETADIRCRMFAPIYGIPEDPATGSANVSLVGLLAQLSPHPELTVRKTILQGAEMGRPSLLEAIAVKEAGAVKTMLIGGSCVPVMHGTIDLF